MLKSCQSSPALERLFSICANLDSSENQVTLGLTIFRYIYKIIPAYIEQVYRIFSWRPCWRAETIKQFCMKIYLISKGRDNVLFLPSNMAAMTSHENASSIEKSLLFCFQMKFAQEHTVSCFTQSSCKLERKMLLTTMLAGTTLWEKK